MLAKLRTFLDEATTELYIDASELYPALAEAQRELVQAIANNWYDEGRGQFKRIPKAIMPLLTAVSAAIASGSNSFALATIVVPVSMDWDFESNPGNTAEKQCLFIGSSGVALKLLENSLLVDGRYCWWDGVNVYVNPISADNASSYTFSYIKEPSEIGGAVQPDTDAIAHDAIVERACWILLKDRESEQANIHLQLYGTLLQGLMQ